MYGPTSPERSHRRPVPFPPREGRWASPCPPGPGPAGRHALLRLQPTAGNRAVGRLLATRQVQRQIDQAKAIAVAGQKEPPTVTEYGTTNNYWIHGFSNGYFHLVPAGQEWSEDVVVKQRPTTKLYGLIGDTAGADQKRLEEELLALQNDTAAMPDANPCKASGPSSKEWWFNYLFTELPDRRRKALYFHSARVVGGRITLGDSELRRILTDMLGEGFTRIQPSEGTRPVRGMVEQAPEYSRMSTRGSPTSFGLPRLTETGLAFRGDTRKPSLIEAHGGTKAKILVDPVRASLGMDEAWHPFSDRSDPVNDLMLWRNNNKDNDLFTMVSIAADLRDAAKFPLREDVEREERHALGGPGRNVHLSYIYVVKVETGFDTEAWQTKVSKPFGHGEKAVRSIAFDRHLAYLRVERTFKGERSSEGVTIKVLEAKPLDALDAEDEATRRAVGRLIANLQGATFEHESFFQEAARHEPAGFTLTQSPPMHKNLA